MSDTTLTPLKTTKLPYVVSIPLFVEYGTDLNQTVLSFFKTKALPLQDGPGFKANRTKVLKNIINDVSKIDSPYTTKVVESLNDVLNPSPSRPVMDTSSDLDMLLSDLTDDVKGEDDDVKGEDTPS